MAILSLNTENFEAETENTSAPVLVDFWAEACPHCVALAPRLDELDHEACGRAKICKVNVDEQPVLAARFGIMSVPTMIFFKGGEIIGRMVGCRDKKEIRDALAL